MAFMLVCFFKGGDLKKQVRFEYIYQICQLLFDMELQIRRINNFKMIIIAMIITITNRNGKRDCSFMFVVTFISSVSLRNKGLSFQISVLIHNTCNTYTYLTQLLAFFLFFFFFFRISWNLKKNCYLHSKYVIKNIF